MFLIFFLCLFSCIVCLFSIFCILCFCIVLCIFSTFVYGCLFPSFVQVHQLLPLGGNPFAVKKYHNHIIPHPLILSVYLKFGRSLVPLVYITATILFIDLYEL